MNELPEMLKGLTDIPLALAACLFGILLTRRKAGGKWAALFFLISVSAVLGTAVHVFAMPQAVWTVVWMILYVLLFEAIRRFGQLMTAYITGQKRQEYRAVRITEIALYLFTVSGMFFLPFNEILVFVFFAVLQFARIMIALIRYPQAPADAKRLPVFVVLPLVIQALSGVIPYAVVMVHILLIAALFAVYLIGSRDGQNPMD